MIRFTKFLLAAAVITMPLAACTMTGDSQRQPLASLTEPYAQPFYVNASDILVESKYDPLANPKDVSGTFPTPPDLALKRYAETRLKPAGGAGVLRFIIDDASVFQEQKPSPNPTARWLNVDDKDRYTAVISVSLVRDGVAATAPGAMGNKLRLERTLTIAESSSLADRDRALNNLVAQMLADLDRAVQDSLTNTLKLGAGDIAPSPGPWPVGPVDITPQGMNQ